MIRLSSIYFSFILIVLLFSGCDNSLEDDMRYDEEENIESYISKKGWEYTKSNGVYHIAIQPSYGYEVNNGDTVEFWYTGYTPESTPLVFDTNIESVAVSSNLDVNVRTFEPLRVIAGETNLIEGLKRGLLLTRLNQKSTIIFPSYLGFKDQIVGPLEAWTSLAYDIEVVYLNGKGIQTEVQKLSQIDLSGYTLHSSGLYYQSLVDTSSLHPSETSTVYGWYKCTFPDGSSVEESSIPNAEIDLTSEDITDALRLGFTLTSKGGTFKFVASSPLCYGKNGNDTVDPYQPLLYTVRLDSIKSSK